MQLGYFNRMVVRLQRNIKVAAARRSEIRPPSGYMCTGNIPKAYPVIFELFICAGATDSEGVFGAACKDPKSFLNLFSPDLTRILFFFSPAEEEEGD